MSSVREDTSEGPVQCSLGQSETTVFAHHPGLPALGCLSTQGESLTVSLGPMGVFRFLRLSLEEKVITEFQRGSFTPKKSLSVSSGEILFLILKVTRRCLSEASHYSLTIWCLQVSSLN